MAEALAWWKKFAIYQIYPRSFKDTTGNGIGDLKGILEKLPYLEWLGVRAMWLSPIYPSPMKDFGYDVSDYCDIHPHFGSLNDFKLLIREMHRNNMYLALDFVPNHTSDQHPWFRRSEAKDEEFLDFYVWKDGKVDSESGEIQPPNNWKSVFGGPAWSWSETRRQFYLHHFLSSQPDLNYRNERVRREMERVLEFWLDLGVDGFRADAVAHLLEPESFSDSEPYTHHPDTYQLIREWSQFVKDYGTRVGKEILFLTEAYGPIDLIREYYRSGISFPFNFELTEWTKLNSHQNWLRQRVDGFMTSLEEGWWPNWVLSNHDQPRVADRLAKDDRFIDVANMLLLLLPGTPTCYYGDELGLTKIQVTYEQCQDPFGKRLGEEKFKESFSRDVSRAPMPWSPDRCAGFTEALDGPWLPLNADCETRNVHSQQTEPDSHLNFFRHLLQLRQEDPVLASASGRNFLILESGSDSVFMFARLPEREGLDYGFLVILQIGTYSESSVRIPKFCLQFEEGAVNRGEILLATPGSRWKPGDTIRFRRLDLRQGEGLLLKFSMDLERQNESLIDAILDRCWIL